MPEGRLDAHLPKEAVAGRQLRLLRQGRGVLRSACVQVPGDLLEECLAHGTCGVNRTVARRRPLTGFNDLRFEVLSVESALHFHRHLRGKPKSRLETLPGTFPQSSSPVKSIPVLCKSFSKVVSILPILFMSNCGIRLTRLNSNPPTDALSLAY
jgi:hypothetical protein